MKKTWIACRAYQRSDARQGYRNGDYNRTLDTRHGSLRLRVPRVRSGDFQSCVYDLYKRPSCEIERMITDWVAEGQTTRAVERSLQNDFGDLVSATTVSRVVAGIDKVLQQFHKRGLAIGYRIVWLDAKHAYVCRRRKHGKRG